MPAHISKLLTLFIAVSAFALSPVLANSLYDPSNARSPDASVSRFLGSRSGSIKYDDRMLRAARIAENRARSRSIKRCWRYVKTALLEAHVVQSYPGTVYARQAGDELSRKHGFKKLPIRDPYKAPVGSVLVYGGRGAGHVEIRTRQGFVSDFTSRTPSPRPLIGVFVKPPARGG